jgi:hypothetical protein
MIVSKCEYCGKEKQYKSKSLIKRFCSHKFSNKWKWENIWKRAETTDIKCMGCGKIFKADSCDTRVKNKTIKYCCKECADKGRKTGKLIKCLICGKEFYSTRQKLCSKECSNKFLHRRETKGNYRYSKNNDLVKKFKYMYKRCYDKNDINYKNYGERGIKIYDKWLYDRDLFVDWALVNGYKKGLEIDRVNVNGNYEPFNCKFVTKTENARNKRNTVKYLYRGKLAPLTEIAEKENIKYKTLWRRLKVNNHNIDDALKQKSTL